MDIALIAVSVLALALGVALAVAVARRGRPDEGALRVEAELSALRSEVGASLQQATVALSALITESGAGMRQEVADRLAAGLTDMRERVETQLAAGREENRREAAATTEAVMKRLGESGKATEERIAALDKRNADSLDAIKVKVDERLMVIGQQVQAKLDENMKEGFSHFTKVQEHLQKAEAQLMGVTAVGTSINELNNLLKLPHLRGGFGEANLEMLIADFLPSSLYEMQAQVSPGSPERVDVLVKLPGANLPIDSKFPREQVLALFETSDSAGLVEARKALARVVREQAKDIAAKYIKPEAGTTDMALMFLPSETLYFEVVRDGDLWAMLKRFKVYPVSPNTLAVTLNGVALSYEYYQMAKGVEKTIEDLKKARKHFGYFAEKFDAVGKQLDRAKDAYNTATTHLGRYTGSVARLTGEEAGEIEETGE
ncbi:MAG: DNA recombination protein RmuC [Nitrospirae bacterium]|nr:DNA recombination protein RmuC [Nitrospirota bacterium]